MGCIDSEGPTTELCVQLLRSLELGLSCPDEMARSTGIPIFRVRSLLHELTQAGLAEENNDCYEITEEGTETLNKGRGGFNDKQKNGSCAQ